ARLQRLLHGGRLVAVGIGLEPTVCSRVPYQYRAAAVLAARDRAFAIGIMKGMILGFDRTSLDARIGNRPLGDCPGFEYVTDFQSKVIMQLRSRVLLNHEYPVFTTLPASA